jgi:hypothetical protein
MDVVARSKNPFRQQINRRSSIAQPFGFWPIERCPWTISRRIISVQNLSWLRRKLPVFLTPQESLFQSMAGRVHVGFDR